MSIRRLFRKVLHAGNTRASRKRRREALWRLRGARGGHYYLIAPITRACRQIKCIEERRNRRNGKKYGEIEVLWLIINIPYDVKPWGTGEDNTNSWDNYYKLLFHPVLFLCSVCRCYCQSTITRGLLERSLAMLDPKIINPPLWFDFSWKL